MADDLVDFCTRLQAADPLLNYNGGTTQAKVIAGKNGLVAIGAPPRIVIFPIGGSNGGPDDIRQSVISSMMLVTAHCWAKNFVDAWILRTAFFQALRIQADGVDGNPGYYWQCAGGEDERWDIKPDASQQGQEFEIDIKVKIDVDKPASYLTTGTVAATSMARVATLTAGIGTGDNIIPVDATYEQITSGVLHIDDEQMSFSGVTATSFTGVVRGINKTTAATHASGTAVYVSPI